MSVNKALIAQPEGPLRKSKKRYSSGSKAAVHRLECLGFDPIVKLVEQFRRIEEELEYFDDWRSLKVVHCKSDGRPRHYTDNTCAVHLSLYDKLIAISEKLLRYRYGRVPEIQEIEHRRAPLVVQLTGENEVFSIDPNAQIDMDEDDD